MVDPNTLLVLARELMTDSREVSWRCAVSRAYYAAFHAARNGLRRLGFEIRQGDQAHAAIHRRWANCGLPEWQQVGQLLNGLRTERNEADYDVNTNLGRDKADAAVIRAASIVEQLNRSLTKAQHATIVDAIAITNETFCVKSLGGRRTKRSSNT